MTMTMTSPTTPFTPDSLRIARVALGVERHRLAELALILPDRLSRLERGQRTLRPIEELRFRFVLEELEEAMTRIREQVVRLELPDTPRRQWAS
jgi:hypothetical protein